MFLYNRDMANTGLKSLEQFIKQSTDEHVRTMKFLLQGEELIEFFHKLPKAMIKALKKDKKILVCGNGGSASDSAHFAAELTGRYFKNRPALAAINLASDMSALTAMANDFGYENVFSRQVEAVGKSGDVLLAISTSGKSPNILKAIEQARKQNITTILLTGGEGYKHSTADYVFSVPSTSTPRIQEAHIFLLHLMAEIIEREVF
jgi:D-sedoheptulose 7-phosphate isomerase